LLSIENVVVSILRDDAFQRKLDGDTTKAINFEDATGAIG
jgi:hypothetical protein